MYYVYLYMLGDQCVYVGKSKNNLKERIWEHSRDSRFKPYNNSQILYCKCKSKSDMDITERVLIKIMHPVVNIFDKTDGCIPFALDLSAVTWFDYKTNDCINIEQSNPIKTNNTINNEKQLNDYDDIEWWRSTAEWWRSTAKQYLKLYEKETQISQKFFDAYLNMRDLYYASINKKPILNRLINALHILLTGRQ